MTPRSASSLRATYPYTRSTHALSLLTGPLLHQLHQLQRHQGFAPPRLPGPHPHPHPQLLPSHLPQADTRLWRIYTHTLTTTALPTQVSEDYGSLTVYRCGRTSTNTSASLTSPRSAAACTAACRATAHCLRWATLTMAVLSMVVHTMAACRASRRGSRGGSERSSASGTSSSPYSYRVTPTH